MPQALHITRRRALAGAAALLIGFNCASAQAADLVVSAAASLTNAFNDIGRAFERVNPGAKVVFNFAASDVLLAQIVKGAPADVFASADEKAMDKAVEQNVIDTKTRRNFVRNRLVLIVPADSHASVTGLQSLSAPAIKHIAIGNPASVPVGRYTKGVLEKANMWTSLEPKFVNATSVRQALDYVARAETDAGFVYSTDAAIMKGKVKIAAEVQTATPIVYPIAVVKDSKSHALAQSFLTFLNSPAMQTVLSDYGFGKP
ncbi:MAG TPA: molybdate ABC transporter substrate-binding protein [Burkholderiales bacterium]|jgi:molybdate transport system substrate-binding protein